MKVAGYKVELVREFVKDSVYEGRDLSDDQLYIFAKQHRRMHILKNKVDWVITDSPLLLSAVYAPNNYLENFIPLVLEAYHHYDNINFLIVRDENKPYEEYGRTQTLEEAKEIDEKSKKLMIDNRMPYYSIEKDAVEEIFRIISSSEDIIKTSNLSELVHNKTCLNCGLGYQIVYNSASKRFEIYCGCSNKPIMTAEFLKYALEMIDKSSAHTITIG